MASMSTLEWNEYAVISLNQLASDVGRNLSVMLKNMIKESMGTSGFPRIVTGKLKASISSIELSKFLFEVSSDVEYAPHVEFGTVRSAPYPYFRPNIDRLKGFAKGAVI